MLSLFNGSSLRPMKNDLENKDVSPKSIPCHKEDLHKTHFFYLKHLVAFEDFSNPVFQLGMKYLVDLCNMLLGLTCTVQLLCTVTIFRFGLC